MEGITFTDVIIQKDNIHIIKVEGVMLSPTLTLLNMRYIGNKGVTHQILLELDPDNINLFKLIDDYMIKQGIDKRYIWPFADGEKDIRYKQSIRYLDDTPVLKLNCQKTKTFKTIIGENIINGQKVNIKLELFGIWINNNDYGIYYKLHEIIGEQATCKNQNYQENDLVQHIEESVTLQ